MLKLTSILNENTSNVITIDDIEKLAFDKFTYWETKSLLKTIISFYESEKEQEQLWAKDYLQLLNTTFQHILKLVSDLKIPHVEIRTIKKYLLEHGEFRNNVKDFFPFPLYVSASSEDDATIGIMVDYEGKILEIHEGNDEATPETINMVNKMVNPKGKQVRIYAAHNTKLIHKIDETGYLPANLYVSPNRGHAEGHMDLTGERSMFTGFIDINSVSQESDLDWRTLESTKIEKLRWL